MEGVQSLITYHPFARCFGWCSLEEVNLALSVLWRCIVVQITHLRRASFQAESQSWFQLLTGLYLMSFEIPQLRPG